MHHTLINPDGLHDPTPMGYSHTASIPAGAELVVVAGQYASDATGAVASGDFADQVRRAFDNLATALAAHGLGLGDVVQLRTYVVDVDVDKLGSIGATVQRHWGSTPPPNTLVGVAGLAMPHMQFEVEAIAARPASD